MLDGALRACAIYRMFAAWIRRRSGLPFVIGARFAIANPVGGVAGGLSDVGYCIVGLGDRYRPRTPAEGGSARRAPKVAGWSEGETSPSRYHYSETACGLRLCNPAGAIYNLASVGRQSRRIPQGSIVIVGSATTTQSHSREPVWYSVTRVSKKFFSLGKSVAWLIHGKGLARL